MAGAKEIKRRIKSVRSTRKITKAMELVAASKMRRAVAQTLASRLYASYSWELLTSLSAKLEDITHPLFVEQKEGRTLLVLVTSNGSLCGGYNAQVIKRAVTMLKNTDASTTDIIAIGKKGDAAMRRTGQNILATFTELPAVITLADVRPISSLLLSEYKKGIYKDVYVAYTDFVSALSQKPKIRRLLPISKFELKEMIESVADEKSKEELSTPKNETPYLFEGDMNTLIESLAEKLSRMQIYQMLLESNASEQSSRMVAMKNASEAAGEMIKDLTLVFNKARQSSITQEISEISAGMASVS